MKRSVLPTLSEARSGTGTSTHLAHEIENLKQEMGRLKMEKSRDNARIRYLEQERTISTKVRLEEIKKVVQQAQELDLAFLVDATSSMQPSINMVKDEIAAMATGISDSYPACKLRVALAVYRDYGEPVDDGCNFTFSYKTRDSEFSRALSRITCKGGGTDFAEDVFTGLENAAGLNWQSTNRLLVHIGDAPCHGSQFHDLDKRDDNYIKGDKYGRDSRKILQKLQGTCKITLYCFCHITDDTHKMVQEFRKVTGDDWVQEWRLNDIRKIPEQVVRVSKLTIAKSLSVFPSGGSAEGKYLKERVEEKVPSWTSIKAEEGIKCTQERISSLSHLLDTIRENRALKLIRSTNAQIKIALHPFSGEGAVRWPYYALISDRVFPPWPREVVIKRFKTPYGKLPTQVHAKDRYVQQMEVQTVAGCMAKEFNERTKRLLGVTKIQFTKVSLLEAGGKFYTMEKLLRGKWTRYSNNGQYVNMRDYAATLQAFSHWTYHVSNGLLMVTDLQGVKEQDLSGRHVFCLCDPAIHTNDENVMRFTGTNLGEVGFRLFMDSHNCNDICRHLSLPAGKCGRINQRTIVTWMQ